MMNLVSPEVLLKTVPSHWGETDKSPSYLALLKFIPPDLLLLWILDNCSLLNVLTVLLTTFNIHSN